MASTPPPPHIAILPSPGMGHLIPIVEFANNLHLRHPHPPQRRPPLRRPYLLPLIPPLRRRLPHPPAGQLGRPPGGRQDRDAHLAHRHPLPPVDSRRPANPEGRRQALRPRRRPLRHRRFRGRVKIQRPILHLLPFHRHGSVSVSPPPRTGRNGVVRVPGGGREAPDPGLRPGSRQGPAGPGSGPKKRSLQVGPASRQEVQIGRWDNPQQLQRSRTRPDRVPAGKGNREKADGLSGWSFGSIGLSEGRFRGPTVGLVGRSAHRFGPVHLFRERRDFVARSDNRAGGRVGADRAEVPVGPSLPGRHDVKRRLFRHRELRDPLAYLPEGFLERTRGRGLVVPLWAPQAKILAHGSVGAFLTHCGFNSILESVVNGVPMIGWPLYAEQKMNAVMLHEDVRVALRPRVGENGLVGRVEVANVVKGLMEGEEGKGIRSRIRDLKNAAANVVDKNGSSTESLAELAGKWESNNINIASV